MSRLLIIAEHDGSQLNAATSKCLSCAKEIGTDQIDVMVIGHEVDEVARQAAAFSAANQVIQIDHPELADTLAATWAPEIVQAAADYSHVLGPSSTFGKDLMPRVAALLGVNQVSDVMQVLGPYQFKRPVYAGNAIIEVQAPEDVPLVATVRTASYAALDADDGNADIVKRDAGAERPDHTRYVGLESEGGERPDLTTARVVVSGGRALGSAENFDLIYSLADKLGAAVGASRAAVDAGYVPNDMQVGQTGKIISPELYLAFGISGAIQHVTGIKDAGTIVAVNKDPDAPIFELADIGLVGDLFTVIPEIEAALSA